MKLWKIGTIFSFVILAASFGLLGYNLYSKGEWITRDIELTGGKQISISVETIQNIDELQKAFPETNVRSVIGIRNIILVEAPFDFDENLLFEKFGELGIVGDISVRTVGPSLGSVFWSQAQLAIVLAFIFMGIVVFIIFRSFVPSAAIMLAATTDIVVTLTILSIIGIKLSLPVLAGLLMLIGYSVDTDVLLTTELRKSRNKEISQRVHSALRTGLTMTLTSLAALISMYLISGNPILQQIATVLIIGLIIDIPATWVTNAGILRMWTERKEAIK